MLHIYLIAAFSAGWLFPEFLRMIAPRNYTIPFSMNALSGFIAAAVLHYILTH
jgi:hypothetical protein